jgi:hypothetical protein
MSSRRVLQPSHPQVSAGESTAMASSSAPGAIDFERLVARDGWWRLAPDIRRRFSEKPKPDAPMRYIGVMQRVRRSKSGWLFAQCCRLIGTPFAPHRGVDVPVAITLHSDVSGGVIWERQYRYPNRRPVVVSSIKRVDADGSLLECVGFGLGMRLAVFEANHALHFLSVRYFWRIGRRQIQLPHFLTPGTAHVIHQDLGRGRFRFTMTIHHRLFGTLFQQDGVFQRQGALP